MTCSGAGLALGTLVRQARALRAQLSKLRGPNALARLARLVASALTAVELRLLVLLSTHLTSREIAERMSLSRTTIKSQSMSIYRKLGTSSRSQAVARPREPGLPHG